MTSFARVRRKRNAEAVEALVLVSKKCKSDTSDKTNDDIKSLFIFTGTISEQDASLSKHIKDAISKSSNIKRNFSKIRQLNITEKIRRDHQTISKASRYRLLGTYRNIKVNELDKIEEESDVEKSEHLLKNIDELADVVNLYDIEQEEEEETVITIESDEPKTKDLEITCNGVTMVRRQVDSDSLNPDHYVYDLYYLNDSQKDTLQDPVNIEAFSMDFQYENCFEEDDFEVVDDDEDSNDENNWRNDYPEEDSYFGSGNCDTILDEMAACSLSESDSDDLND